MDVTLHAETVAGMDRHAIGILHARLTPCRAVLFLNEQHPFAQAINDALHHSGTINDHEHERGQDLAEWVRSRLDRLVEHGPELDGWGVFLDDDGPFYQLSVRRIPQPAYRASNV